MSIKAFYSDLDGTMVGPGGCFVRNVDSKLTAEPTLALIELLAAEIDLVLVSGRTREQLLEAARIFGADGYVAEMGAIIGWDAGRQSTLVTGQTPSEFAGQLVAQLESIGLVDALFRQFEGRLTYHAPWHLGHETDVMLHGQVDVDEVDQWLADRNFGWLTLDDNGVLPSVTMPGLTGSIHVYHLIARGISKGRSVALDLERRGLGPEQAVAVGDSLSDLDMASHVKQLFLVANGGAEPSIRAAAEKLPNVTVCDDSVGLGWAQAARQAVQWAGSVDELAG